MIGSFKSFISKNDIIFFFHVFCFVFSWKNLRFIISNLYLFIVFLK